MKRSLALMGAAVRTERERRQMTDEEMAEAVGVTLVTYRNLERGDAYGMHVSTLLTAMLALDIRASDMFGEPLPAAVAASIDAWLPQVVGNP